MEYQCKVNGGPKHPPAAEGGHSHEVSGVFMDKGEVSPLSGTKLSSTSGVFIAHGIVKPTAQGIYVVKGVVRALFEAANKSVDPGVYIVKGSVKKLF